MEVIVSASILSLVIVFVVSLFPSSMVAIKSSESRIQADLLADDLLEQMRQLPFDKLQPLAPGSLSRHGSRFHYSTQVSEVSGSDSRFLKRIRAVVTWRERRMEKSVTREAWIHALRR